MIKTSEGTSFIWELGCFLLKSSTTGHWALDGGIGTSLPLNLANDSRSWILSAFSVLKAMPITLAAICVSGIIYFVLRSSVSHAPFMPMVYFPVSTPINKSSSEVPTNSNSYSGISLSTSLNTATSKPSDCPFSSMKT